ncbi:MAG TPA: hypothetical protein VMJ94_03730 [Nitrososphaera sp.]|nr:hypothetical protein [Nitrososphaera sp.]
MQGPQSIQMHRDITRLRSLGVGVNFFRTGSLTPEIARDLVGGLLYLRERYLRQA